MKALAVQVTAAGPRIVLTTKRATGEYVEALHPRDRMGRWIEKGAWVSIWGGGQGRVLRMMGHGRVQVARTDGGTVAVDAGNVTVLKNPPGVPVRRGEPPPQAPQPREAPQVRPADPAAPPVPDGPLPGRPAPDATPVGADAYFRSPDDGAEAWLVRDDDAAMFGGDPHVGFIRPDAANPGTTRRVDDADEWAAWVDGAGMDEQPPPVSDVTPPDPLGRIPDLSDVASFPGDERAADPEWISAMLVDGLGWDESRGVKPGATHDGSDRLILTPYGPAAHREVTDDLTRRMQHVPDADLLPDEDLAVLAAISPGGDAVLLGGVDGVPLRRDIVDMLRRDRPDALAGQTAVTPEAYRADRRRKAVSRLVAAWGVTSNDGDPEPLAMQEVARDLFGMEGTAGWAEGEDTYSRHLAERVAATRRQRETLHAEFLLAQYDATQERFAAEGISHVRIYRGHRVYRSDLGVGGWPDDAFNAYEEGIGATVDIPLRPLSSFSTDREVALGFAARGGPGVAESVVLEGVVPVERILSTPRTGAGTLDEREIVVLGGSGAFTVRRASDTSPTVEPIPPDEDLWAEPADPSAADSPAGLILDAEDLRVAIAAAGTDPERRRALIERADTLGLATLIPDAWRPATGGGDQARYDPMADDLLDENTLTFAAGLDPRDIPDARTFAAAVVAEFSVPDPQADWDRRRLLVEASSRFDIPGLDLSEWTARTGARPRRTEE